MRAQENQVVSRKRVADHGEVYTGRREVTRMLDLVHQETTRIDSRFLEPACGTGNFLIEILERKLRIVDSRYGNSQLDYERYAILAVSSLYGIDILGDNVAVCRMGLFDLFDRQYTGLFGIAATDECRAAIKYLLERNIVRGDALTLTTVGEAPHIVFSEWSPVNGSFKAAGLYFPRPARSERGEINAAVLGPWRRRIHSDARQRIPTNTFPEDQPMPTS